MSTLTTVQNCAATACAYNDGGCTAYVTIGGNGNQASCGTFIELDARGGLPVAGGHVGACQRLECVHNDNLMCGASAITVGGDTANCLTYEVR